MPPEPTQGSRIRRARRVAGLSQNELARLLHTNVTQVSRWECDRADPRIDTKYRLAKALKVEFDDLFDRVAA